MISSVRWRASLGPRARSVQQSDRIRLLTFPCHRVIRNTGLLGGYRWGEGRKRAILGWEAARAMTRNGKAP